MNPHNWLTRLGEPPLDRWECQYCHAAGTFAELVASECSYEYPPCPYCGETPQCASNCPGILIGLTSPGVHVIRNVRDPHAIHYELRRALNDPHMLEALLRARTGAELKYLSKETTYEQAIDLPTLSPPARSRWRALLRKLFGRAASSGATEK